MPNSWGRRPPNNWRDLKGIAVWVLIIGIVFYIIFPDFFYNIYSSLSEPESATAGLGEVTLPQSSLDYDTSQYDSLYSYDSSLYNSLGLAESEVTTGYWVIFVGDGEFRQLELSSEIYNFLNRLIQSDQKAASTQTIFLVSNGQLMKYSVSEEVYLIISSISTINGRTNPGTLF